MQSPYVESKIGGGGQITFFWQLLSRNTVSSLNSVVHLYNITRVWKVTGVGGGGGESIHVFALEQDIQHWSAGNTGIW